MIRKTILFKGEGETFEQTFSQRYKDGQEAHEKMSYFIRMKIREMQIKITLHTY